MKGQGFLIWKLAHVIPVAAQIAVWKEIGIEWVSIKVREYLSEWNRYAAANSGSLRLEDFILACKEAGIKVGTWQFVYTQNLAKQAQLVSQDIIGLGLDHLMIDAEENGRVSPYAHWKTFPKYKTEAMADAYLDSLDLPEGVQVGLCSYRYPESHREFPWEAFLSHPRLDMLNPQLYWIQANNPGYQTATSLSQYRKLTDKPFYPIGSAYEELGWKPTAAQIGEFTELCKVNFKTWGWYRWGQAKDHQDWLQEMKVEVEYPVPIPVPPPVFEIPKACLADGVSALRIRSGPSTGYGTVGYVKPDQPIVEILEKKEISAATVWYRIGYGQWSAARYNNTVYLEDL